MDSIRERLQVDGTKQPTSTAVLRFEVHTAPGDSEAHELWIHLPGRLIVRWRISPAAWLDGGEPLLAIEQPPLLAAARAPAAIDAGAGVVDRDAMHSLRRLEQGLLTGRFCLQLQGARIHGVWCFVRFGRPGNPRWVVWRESARN